MKEKNLQKYAKICKFRIFAKKIYVILFFTLQIFYNIFCNFQKFTPKEIFALKFFFCKNKIFNSIPIEVLLQCFVENLADSSYKLFYFS